MDNKTWHWIVRWHRIHRIRSFGDSLTGLIEHKPKAYVGLSAKLVSGMSQACFYLYLYIKTSFNIFIASVGEK